MSIAENETAGVRVLVVDDEPGITEALGEALTESGYTVRCCGRGDEALALAQSSPPDLILLDIRLPGLGGADGLDGLRVAERLARDERTRDVPLLLITAVGRHERGPWEDLLARSGQHVLFKPFTLTDLLARVEQLLVERGHTAASAETA